jgi:hypothetical protein
MKKLILISFLFISFLFADNAKKLALACESYRDIGNTKNIEETMKDGLIPRNCIFLTSNAKITIVDSSLEDKRIVKILIIDLGTYMYSLKKDIIVTNENKI